MAGEGLSSFVEQDEIRFEVSDNGKVRVYANSGFGLEIACRLCDARHECDGQKNGLLTPCSVPCG